MNYVLGFLFSEDKARVVLIEKKRPAWQAGKLNGVGGKVEKDEPIHEAMVREFYEETGLRVPCWKYFARLHGETDNDVGTKDSWAVHCFIASGDVDAVQTVEDEEILVLYTGELHEWNIVPNLHGLVPLAITNFTRRVFGDISYD